MSIIQSARNHFSAKRSISIPEWPDADGKPCVVWWRPITAEEQSRVSRMSEAKGDGPAEFSTRLLIEKAEDEAGNKLFTLADQQALLTEVDFTIINRITGAMLNIVSQEQARKN